MFSTSEGLFELARALAATGTQLLASGGSRSTLVAAGLDVIEVADYTGQPEVFGGRVKTLHPKIHGGILARRDEPEDLATLERQGFCRSTLSLSTCIRSRPLSPVLMQA